MTTLTTLRTAQLFQMSCPLISSTVGIRIGSTAAAWLVDSPPAPAPAADGSGETRTPPPAKMPNLEPASQAAAVEPIRMPTAEEIKGQDI